MSKQAHVNFDQAIGERLARASRYTRKQAGKQRDRARKQVAATSKQAIRCPREERALTRVLDRMREAPHATTTRMWRPWLTDTDTDA